MANFQTHITTSAVLGVAVGALGNYYLGYDWGAVFLAAGLTAIGGVERTRLLGDREGAGHLARGNHCQLPPRQAGENFQHLSLRSDQCRQAVGIVVDGHP